MKIQIWTTHSKAMLNHDYDTYQPPYVSGHSHYTALPLNKAKQSSKDTQQSNYITNTVTSTSIQPENLTN